MIQSMTGFGRAEFEVAGTAFQVEMRSVNHRHLDLQARLPRSLSAFEPVIRARLQARFGRGKLDVVVGMPAGQTVPQELDIDLDAAARYVEASRALADRHGGEARLDASALLGLPGVARFVERALPAEPLEERLLAAVDEAADALGAMRATEGAAIERELRQRLAAIARLIDELEERAGQVSESVRERLRKRAAQLAQETGLLDEARLHQEIVIAADRLDVREELVRLRSHVEQFGASLASADASSPVGRRLEFLLQEMLRETNTVGSKGSDAPIAHRVVDLKSELERIREQVLNVE